MKKLKLILLLMMVSLVTMADEYLVVHHQDGTQTEFGLATKPIITIQDGNMLVKSRTADFSIAIANVKNYSFSDLTTGIRTLDTNLEKPVVSNGHVVFSKLQSGNCIQVYAVDGRQIRSYTADATGVIDVDLTTLPKGTYIVGSPASRIKITNK